MRTVGIFEAKAKLSEICERVAHTGESVVVTRRGKPLVRIDPIETTSTSVWEDRAKYVARRGAIREELDLPERSRDMPAWPPLDD